MRPLLSILILDAPLLLGSLASPTPPQMPLFSNDNQGSDLTKNESLEIPGNSPAYLKGDPSKDTLVLEMFNLIPKVLSRSAVIPFIAVFTLGHQQRESRCWL